MTLPPLGTFNEEDEDEESSASSAQTSPVGSPQRPPSLEPAVEPPPLKLEPHPRPVEPPLRRAAPQHPAPLIDRVVLVVVRRLKGVSARAEKKKAVSFWRAAYSRRGDWEHQQ